MSSDDSLRWRLTAFAGRWLVIIGLLTVGFAGWETWGTNVLADRSQNALAEQFNELSVAGELPAELGLGDEPQPGPTTVTAVPSETPPVPGENGAPDVSVWVDQSTDTAYLVAAKSAPVARLRIPKIGVDRIVVLGDSRADLKKGPGMAATMAAPGSAQGNTVIPGHRTTYGAPFFDFDQLAPGDDIVVDTVYGSFTYRVSLTEVVSPRDPRLMENTVDARLTLYTCHPRYSARQRLLVIAEPVSKLAAIQIRLAPDGRYSGMDIEPVIDGDDAGSGTAATVEPGAEQPDPSVAGSPGSAPATVDGSTDDGSGEELSSLEEERELELALEQGWSRDTWRWAQVAMWFAAFAVCRRLVVAVRRRSRVGAFVVGAAALVPVIGLYIAFGAVVPAGV